MTQECLKQNSTEKYTNVLWVLWCSPEKPASEKTEISLKSHTGQIFTGKEWEPETGTYYFGARRYDPTIGMWLGRDPAGQFESPYVYAGAGMNPVNSIDFDGLELGENATKLYDDLAGEEFYGSEILENDFNELLNSDEMFEYEYSREADYAYNEDGMSYIPEKFEGNVLTTGILFRHEARDHIMLQKEGAQWHNLLEIFDYQKGLSGNYFERLLFNNSLYEGLRNGNHIKGEYDDIYLRDYKIYKEILDANSR